MLFLSSSQFGMSPFFVIFTIRPLFQSLGISFVVHISLKRAVKTFPAVMTSVYSSSVQMLSVPEDISVFICFIAWVTSCSVGTPVAISRSSLGAAGSAVMVGASVLIISVTCSAHRLACNCSVVSAFPPLSLTMLAATLVCLQSCFVIMYTVLSSPFCAAVSAFSASLSP